MPLFGLINKKKTKNQSTTNVSENEKDSTHSSKTGSSSNRAATKATSSTSSSTATTNNKVKWDQSSLTPVTTISNKTPNPFAAKPVDIPKSPTLGLSAPADLEKNRMHSSSPFSTSPQQPQQQQLSPPINNNNNRQPHSHSRSQQQQHQPHLQNVVTAQYNAPPTPPSTARSGSIDDKIDLNNTNTATTTSGQSYRQHDPLKHAQPQQGYQPYSDETPSDAMIATPSGLLTPVPNANDRAIPSRLPSAQTGSSVRTTKGKYSIADFSIQRTLGTGSFGRVHLVQSRHNSRFYAIKVTPPSYNSL